MAPRKQPRRLNKNSTSSEISNKQSRHDSHSPPESPPPLRFFRTILPRTMQDMKLKLPDRWAVKFGDEICNVAKLIVPNSPALKVGLTKSRSGIIFDDGWHEFMQLYSIREGYLLFFRYRGLSKFNVLIFDETYSEIQYPHFGERDINPCPKPGIRQESLNKISGPTSKKSQGMNKCGKSVKFKEIPSLKNKIGKSQEKRLKEEPIVDMEDASETKEGDHPMLSMEMVQNTRRGQHTRLIWRSLPVKCTPVDLPRIIQEVKKQFIMLECSRRRTHPPWFYCAHTIVHSWVCLMSLVRSIYAEFPCILGFKFPMEERGLFVQLSPRKGDTL